MSNKPTIIPPAEVPKRYESGDQFWAVLASRPQNVLVNPFAQNSSYIPISDVEASLDSVFGAMNWQTDSVQITKEGAFTSQKGTEMLLFTCSISLRVLHPILGTWISRSGAASSAASTNQFETFAPKLKAEAFKNAAKSLGKVFGRELNRQQVKEEEVVNDLKREEDKEFKAKLAQCANLEELSAFYQSHPMRTNPHFRALFIKKKQEIEDADTQ